MKKLFVIRHAKSDQSFFGKDFERPLNNRGKNDVVTMSKRLKAKQPELDLLVASPAARTTATAMAFAECFGIKKERILFIPDLYHATEEILLREVCSLPDDCNSVAVFTHNPGITYFVNNLVKNVSLDNMPTCAIFAISAGIDHWNEFTDAEKNLLFFDYPKNKQNS